MVGIVNTGSVPKALQVGVNRFWGMGYREKTPLQRNRIFYNETSEKAYEEDVQIVGTGKFQQKAEGAPISYDSIRQGFVKRYPQVTWALGINFTYEMIQDKQYDLGFKQAKYLGYSARQTQEVNSANVLNRAFNTSYTGADGKALCVTDHPNISGGTFSNTLATAADFSHAALEQICIQIGQAQDDRGNIIGLRAVKLVGPENLKYDFARVLKSTQESGTPNNDINAIRSEENLETVINSYLTDTDAWFVLTDIMEGDGLKVIIREAVSAPRQENDFDTFNLKYASLFREVSGWTDPRHCFGSAGA
jgi:hypothetical protein